MSLKTNNNNCVAMTTSTSSVISSLENLLVKHDRGNRFQVLSHDQVVRLHEVMEASIPVLSRDSACPPIRLSLRDLVRTVRDKLANEDVEVRDIRLNGTTASYIIGKESSFSYNDIDLLFGVDLSVNRIQKVKSAVLDALMSFLPTPLEDTPSSALMNRASMQESYVQKMVRIYNPDGDLWSLIGLGSPHSTAKTVELKFVDKMRRQFEFTVDSFQIILDTLLTFYEVSTQPITEHFYPTVVAESVAGSFKEAEYHLNHKLISTRNPEEIRGGGLFKYCRLLVEGYRPAEPCLTQILERYMCSRFFIDFPDLAMQRNKLENYLWNHFADDEDIQVHYLELLYKVVSKSTVCLMHHERYQSLNLIKEMIARVIGDLETKKSVVQLDAFNTGDWVLDQVFYGTSYFPNPAYFTMPSQSVYPNQHQSFSVTSDSGYYDPQMSVIMVPSDVSTVCSSNSSNVNTPIDLTPVDDPTKTFPCVE